MEIRMLGPFAVAVDQRELVLAGPKQRAVLSCLALRASATVPIDRLVDALWGEDPPASAEKMVQQYVSQLRRLLAQAGGPEILTHGRGYELRVEPAAVDVLRFEQLVDQAGRAEDGNRRELARQALDLWHGPAFADLREEPFAASETRRLEELQLRATEVLIQAELEVGDAATLVAQLRGLVDEHPLRERLRGLLMLALYRAGRQAEALDAFQEARWTLVEELGLEPGPELRRLQEAILRQDPALERVVPDTAWASRETAQQVGTGAGRISQARGALRADERELAANLVDLHTLRGRQAPRAATGAACPFKGLESFDVGDAELYFGRERLVARIVAQLPGTSLLGVIGPSGSGKSSCVRAGLLPALASGTLPGSERWNQALMRPGEHPSAALRRALRVPEAADPVAAALAELPAQARLLLVVDQFEEAFTACRDEGERSAFLDAIVAPAARGDPRYLVVCALRADYYGACAAHPRLARLLGESHVLVGAMRPGELARAIEGPSERVGLDVDRDLVARLVEETTGAPGGLPLLSTTLLELWQDRSGDRLTIAAYDRTGGVQGAVARLAEKAFQRLSSDEAATARNLLMRLANVGEPGPAVRRRVPLTELDLARSEAARRVFEVLTENRLLTVGGDSVEVAHEALLSEWPRLRQWIEDDSEARRLHRHLTFAARDWDAGGRDDGELYRGARLALALDLAAERGDALNALEREFIEAAREGSERDALRGRRLNRRLRALLAATLVGLVVAAAAGVLALEQRGDARDEARSADAQRLGAQALIDDRPDRALLLARAGVALDDSVATRGSLLATLYRQPSALLGVLPTVVDDAEIFAVAMSPAGDRLALGDAGGRVRVLELPSRRLVATHRVGIATQLAFSPDGRTLAVGGKPTNDEELSAGIVDLLDARTARRRQRVVLPAPGRLTGFVVASPAYVDDGGLLVLQTQLGDAPEPQVLRRIDGATGASIGRPLRLPPGDAHGLIPGGDHVFVTNPAEDSTWAIDPSTLRVLRRFEAGGRTGAVAAGRLALATDGGRVRRLELATGRVRTFAGRHPAAVTALRMTPDARTLVTAGEDGSLLVWDAARGAVRERLDGHSDVAGALAVSPGGDVLLSGGDDGQAFLWELTGRGRLVTPIPLGAPFELPDDPTPRGTAISPDGLTLAVTRADGAVDLLHAGTLRQRARVRAAEQPLLAADFSPDGRLLAVAGRSGAVILLDPATGARRGRLGKLDEPIQALDFSPDGRFVTAGTNQSGVIRVWDVERRASTRFRARAPYTSSLAFSPDGRTIAVAPVEGSAEIRSARTGRLIERLETSALSRSVAFSPDGRLLFVGLLNGAGQFFSVRGWESSGEALRGQDQRLTAAQFTPDGRRLSTASADGTVMVWDVASRKPIGARMMVQRDSFVSTVLSPDGRYLYALPTGREGRRIDLSPVFWSDRACRVAGRELTRREWEEAVPRQPYRSVCR